MSTKPEDDRKQVDNPFWEFVGWAIFESMMLIVRGVWALIVLLFSAVTE